ncbi:hypothetical protein PR202_gb00542 [Eleusine coracana subsp. coracana]|uniref:DDT domain-containing protein PTM n=1 Tax=Eleusine coracana subsp. coracana TaxID=191504 RepID=A0AAV5DUC1_ELECO|nr:hypothetical protein PR202_gb00542 [Eleusine coracana subsp. coracana]
MDAVEPREGSDRVPDDPTAPAADEMKTEAADSSAPIADEVKTEAAGGSAPVADEVKTEAPDGSAPAADEVKTEASDGSAPAADEVKMEAPDGSTPAAAEVEMKITGGSAAATEPAVASGATKVEVAGDSWRGLGGGAGACGVLVDMLDSAPVASETKMEVDVVGVASTEHSASLVANEVNAQSIPVEVQDLAPVVSESKMEVDDARISEEESAAAPVDSKKMEERDGRVLKEAATPAAALLVKEEAGECLVGRYIGKTASRHGRILIGKVASYDSTSDAYSVVFEDGHGEDFGLSQLQQLLMDEENGASGMKVSCRKRKLDLLVSSGGCSEVKAPPSTRQRVDAGEMSNRPDVSQQSGSGSDISEDTDASSNCSDSTKETPSDPCPLVQAVELPPSSGDIAVPEESISHVFSVYNFLRSFSVQLFLSPFGLDDFVAAINCTVQNNLLDAVHVSLLRALKRHLETKSSEGSQPASNCLKYLDWTLLDALTWPTFLSEYLYVMGFIKNLGGQSFGRSLLAVEYYKLPVVLKLRVLQILCDHVIDSEEFKTELEDREGYNEEMEYEMDSSVTSEAGSRAVLNRAAKVSAYQRINDSQNLVTAPNVTNLEAPVANASQDGNSDDCRICGMDGTLVCCDGCPWAYHSRCIGLNKAFLPQGQWFCPECVIDKLGPSSSRIERGARGAQMFGVDMCGRLFLGSCNYLLVQALSAQNRLHNTHVNGASGPSSVSHHNGPVVSASAAANLAIITSEEGKVPSSQLATNARKRMAADNALQLKAFSSAAAQFVWPSTEKKLMEVPRDRCGWCLACRSSATGNKKACFLNMATANAAKGSARVLSIMHVVKNSDSHFTSIVAYLANMEESLHGLLVGSLQDMQQKLRWHKQLQEASNCRTIIPLLLELESNIRGVAFSGSWSKLIDDWPVESPGVSTGASRPAAYQKRGAGGRGRGRKRLVASESGTTTDDDNSWTWWSRGNVSKRILQRGALLCSTLRKAARQGNCHKECTTRSAGNKGNNAPSSLICKVGSSNSAEPPVKGIGQQVAKLESNIRGVAFSGSWSKLIDDWPVESPGVSTGASRPAAYQKRGAGGRGRGRKRLVASESGTTTDDDNSWTWWSRGNVSKRILQRGALLCSTLRKAARQGGKKRIAGISYYEGLNLPRRTRQFAWRACVGLSQNSSQLAFQVRYLDAHIRWKEFIPPDPNTSDGKSSDADFSTLRNAVICDRKIVDNKIRYALKFSNQRHLPVRVTKNILEAENQDENSKLWFSENHVPLYMVREFELKAGTSSLSTAGVSDANCFNPVRAKASIKDVFSYLFHKGDMYPCTSCKKDVPYRDVVKCSSCQGNCHKECTTRSAGNKGNNAPSSLICKLCLQKRSLMLTSYNTNASYIRPQQKINGQQPVTVPKITFRVGSSNSAEPPVKDWFHGDALQLEEESIGELVAYRCCRCRRRAIPQCPHSDDYTKPEPEISEQTVTTSSQTMLSSEGTFALVDQDPLLASYGIVEPIVDDTVDADLSTNMASFAPGSNQKLSIRRAQVKNCESIDRTTRPVDEYYIHNQPPGSANINFGHMNEYPLSEADSVDASELLGWDFSQGTAYTAPPDFSTNYQSNDTSCGSFVAEEFEPQTFFSFTELLEADDAQFDNAFEMSNGLQSDGNRTGNFDHQGVNFDEMAFTVEDGSSSMSFPTNVPSDEVECHSCKKSQPPPDLSCAACGLHMHRHCSPWDESAQPAESASWSCGSCREWR